MIDCKLVSLGAVLVAIALFPHVSFATDYCVSNSNEFQVALTAAANNSADDSIKLRTGTYTGNFFYSAQIENFDVTIDGGWNDNCSDKSFAEAVSILDGGDIDTTLTVGIAGSVPDAEVRLSNIEITNGRRVNRLAGGLQFSASGSLVIDRVSFRQNYAPGEGAAIYVAPGARQITVINSTISDHTWPNSGDVYIQHSGVLPVVFKNNRVSQDHVWIRAAKIELDNNYFENSDSSLRIESLGSLSGTWSIRGNVIYRSRVGMLISQSSSMPVDILIANNSFIECGDQTWGSSRYASRVSLMNNDKLELRNNLFVDTNTSGSTSDCASCPSTVDLYLDNDGESDGVSAKTVIVESNFSTSPDGSIHFEIPSNVWPGNTLVDNHYEIYPGLVDQANKDYRLKKSSILVDAGRGEAQALTKTDFSGDARIQGWAVDVGAYELQTSNLVPLSDINENGSPDLGMLMPGGTQVHVRDGLSGEQVGLVDTGADAALSLDVVGNLDSSGGPELALLTKQADGQVVAQIRDSATGSLFKKVFFGSQYEPIATRVIADYNSTGMPEIAVMGADANDAIRVQIKDAGSGEFLDNVFLGNQSIGRDFVAIPDTSGNGMPELGILSVLKGSNQIRTQVWDAVDATFQGNIWFGKVYEPYKLITIPDISANGADEIAAIGIDRTTQNIRVQVRDSETSATHYNIWLGAVNDAVDIAMINDINADGIGDLAILLNTPQGTGRVRVQSGADGSFIRNLFFSAVSNPTDLAVLPDYSGNGFEELAALGENSGVRHVQILDTSSGSQVNRINFP